MPSQGGQAPALHDSADGATRARTNAENEPAAATANNSTPPSAVVPSETVAALTTNVSPATWVMEIRGALSTLLIPVVPFENPRAASYTCRVARSTMLMTPTLMACT